MTEASREETAFFLPDFYHLRTLFATVVLAELFAFILTLADLSATDALWGHLALTSLFMQWAAMVGAAVLCLSRRPLSRLKPATAGLVSYLLLLTVVVVLSELAFDVNRWLGFPLVRSAHGEFVLRNLATGAIVAGLVLRYFYVQHQWRQRIDAENRARLQALQARIRPHFLFNSMNSIAALIRSDPERAEVAVEDLADLFRASLADERRLIPWEEELALARRYLEMETLRLGERIQVRWEVDAVPPALKVPPLLLQPLVENAVYHGIEPRLEGGEVAVIARLDGSRLALSVTNPVAEGETTHQRGNRMALENIRARLAAHYGPRAGLESVAREGCYRITLHLPLGEEA